MAPPRGGEILWLYDFLRPPFSVSSASPQVANFGPNCTLNGSKVMFRLIHVPFGSLVPSNLLWGGLQSEKPPKTRKSLDCHCHFFTIWPIFTKICENNLDHFDDVGNAHLKKFKMAIAAILNLEKTVAISLLFDQSLPNFVGIWLLWLRSHRWGRKNLRNHNSIRRPPPSGISNSCRHFFTIWSIFTKLSGNIGTLIKNVYLTLKMRSCQNSKWRTPPSSISEIVCHFFTIWQIKC